MLSSLVCWCAALMKKGIENDKTVESVINCFININNLLLTLARGGGRPGEQSNISNKTFRFMSSLTPPSPLLLSTVFFVIFQTSLPWHSTIAWRVQHILEYSRFSLVWLESQIWNKFNSNAYNCNKLSKDVYLYQITLENGLKCLHKLRYKSGGISFWSEEKKAEERLDPSILSRGNSAQYPQC